uniref:Uncharacterized protein n=1 Tax=Corvus moneduloides TaxID=1196302 RepID=A0A8C3DWT2_CORMO
MIWGTFQSWSLLNRRRNTWGKLLEHLVLIGLCLWMVFILVCHIMSFFFPPFLPLSFFLSFPFSEFTSLAGMHIWSLSSLKSSFFFFCWLAVCDIRGC